MTALSYHAELRLLLTRSQITDDQPITNGTSFDHLSSTFVEMVLRLS